MASWMGETCPYACPLYRLQATPRRVETKLPTDIKPFWSINREAMLHHRHSPSKTLETKKMPRWQWTTHKSPLMSEVFLVFCSLRMQTNPTQSVSCGSHTFPFFSEGERQYSAITTAQKPGLHSAVASLGYEQQLGPEYSAHEFGGNSYASWFRITCICNKGSSTPLSKSSG